jgi:hypothetical protein
MKEKDKNTRIRTIIDMLSLMDKDRSYTENIDVAMGKYKMPKTFKEGLRLVKRQRKYGNNKD